jgi:hypothetical protein
VLLKMTAVFSALIADSLAQVTVRSNRRADEADYIEYCNGPNVTGQPNW